MRIALGQFNAVLGDLEGNCEKMLGVYGEALEQNVDLLVFPELAINGYPPEDLLYKDHFVQEHYLPEELKFLSDQ